MPWCYLDLTFFNLAVVTLTFEILTGLYLGDCKVCWRVTLGRDIDRWCNIMV